jgi:hypothetical protein
MKVKVELTNDFHNTAAFVLAEVEICEFEDGDMRKRITLTSSQYTRVKKKLCGLSNCTCGGLRGAQSYLGVPLYVDHTSKEEEEYAYRGEVIAAAASLLESFGVSN